MGKKPKYKIYDPYRGEIVDTSLYPVGTQYEIPGLKREQPKRRSSTEAIAKSATKTGLLEVEGVEGFGEAPTGAQLDFATDNVFETLSEHFNLRTAVGRPNLRQSIDDSSYLLDYFLKPSSENFNAAYAKLKALYQEVFSQDFGLAGYPMIDLPNISTDQLKELLEVLYNGRLRDLEDFQKHDVDDIFEGAEAYLMLFNNRNSTNQFDEEFWEEKKNEKDENGNPKPIPKSISRLEQVGLAQYASRLYSALPDFGGSKIQTANLHQCLSYEVMRFFTLDFPIRHQQVRVPNYLESGEIANNYLYELPSRENPGEAPTFFERFWGCQENGSVKKAAVKLVVPIPLGRE
jgi:hypothetical protein